MLVNNTRHRQTRGRSNFVNSRTMFISVRRSSRIKTNTVSAVLLMSWILLSITNVYILLGRTTTSSLLVSAGHVYTDSFPTNDEYDFMILDADSVYGSPYGGFSRSVSSRLAKLPLKLPHVDVNSDDYQPDYTTIRDNQGRPFACRVYHEDEIDPESFNDSMFNAPILMKSKKDDDGRKYGEEQQEEQGQQKEEEEKPTHSETMGTAEQDNEASRIKTHDGEGELGLHRAESVVEVSAAAGGSTGAEDTTGGIDNVRRSTSNDGQQDGQDVTVAEDTPGPPRRRDPHVIAQELSSRLQALVGMCAQIHMGWWSYSWCHQTDIKQFHVIISKVNGQIQNLEIEDITVLGKFNDRRVKLPERDNLDLKAVETFGKPKYFGDKKPVGAIVETFVGGDVCPETYDPRQTRVTIQCCSEKVIARSKGGVLRAGVPIETDIVSLVEITESKDPPCNYQMTVCTPLLCAQDEDNDEIKGVTKEEANAGDDSSSKISSSSPLAAKDSPRKKIPDGRMDPSVVEEMSVVEVLNAMFGASGKVCILYGTGSWWVYEFCPGGTIRQFHETTIIDRTTGVATNVIETEHFLGRYNAEDHEKVTKDDEWKNMVNITTGPSGGSSLSSPSKNGLGLGGNGAYYFQEYTDGDACINEDVEDSAAYGLKRATTIRYYCGNSLQLTVKEDSTCHYVIDMTIPALCGHPLFKAPISKRQFLKCLPLPLYYDNDS